MPQLPHRCPVAHTLHKTVVPWLVTEIPAKQVADLQQQLREARSYSGASASSFPSQSRGSGGSQTTQPSSGGGGGGTSPAGGQLSQGQQSAAAASQQRRQQQQQSAAEGSGTAEVAAPGQANDSASKTPPPSLQARPARKSASDVAPSDDAILSQQPSALQSPAAGLAGSGSGALGCGGGPTAAAAAPATTTAPAAVPAPADVKVGALASGCHVCSCNATRLDRT